MTEFKIGDRVKHAKGGLGVVEWIDKIRKCPVKVRWDDGGVWWAYANRLTPIETPNEEEIDTNKFKVGDRVRHEKEGVGVVSKIDTTRADPVKVKLDNEDVWWCYPDNLTLIESAPQSATEQLAQHKSEEPACHCPNLWQHEPDCEWMAWKRRQS